MKAKFGNDLKYRPVIENKILLTSEEVSDAEDGLILVGLHDVALDAILRFWDGVLYLPQRVINP